MPTAPEVRNTDDIKLAFETLTFIDGIAPERARFAVILAVVHASLRCAVERARCSGQ